MAYHDLLPRRADLRNGLVDGGLTGEQADDVLRSTAAHLVEWSDFYANRARTIDNDGALQDEGAAAALIELVDDLRPPA